MKKQIMYGVLCLLASSVALQANLEFAREERQEEHVARETQQRETQRAAYEKKRRRQAIKEIESQRAKQEKKVRRRAERSEKKAFFEGGDKEGIPVDIEGKPIFISQEKKEKWVEQATELISQEKKELLQSRNESLKELRDKMQSELGVGKTPLRSKEMNYYDVLGVDKNADPKTAEKAFRKLSLQLHPDKWSASKEYNEKVQKIADAFGVPHEGAKFTNEQREKVYDIVSQAKDVLVDQDTGEELNKKELYDLYFEQRDRIMDTFNNARRMLDRAKKAAHIAKNSTTISNKSIMKANDILSSISKELRKDPISSQVQHRDVQLGDYMKVWGGQFMNSFKKATRGVAQ